MEVLTRKQRAEVLKLQANLDKMVSGGGSPSTQHRGINTHSSSTWYCVLYGTILLFLCVMTPFVCLPAYLCNYQRREFNLGPTVTIQISFYFLCCPVSAEGHRIS